MVTFSCLILKQFSRYFAYFIGLPHSCVKENSLKPSEVDDDNVGDDVDDNSDDNGGDEDDDDDGDG